MLQIFRIAILLAVALFATISEGAEERTISDSIKAIFAIPGTRRDIIIEMEPVLGQVLQNPAISSFTGDSLRNHIIGQLKERTRVSQLPVTKALNRLGLTKKSTSFWIANRIHVKEVDVGAIQALSKITGLSFLIREPVKAKIYPVEEIRSAPRIPRQSSDNGTTIQYGVQKIGAPQVWAAGNTGKGSTVGIIDTGVNYQHIALTSTYKNDNFSWYDAFEQYPEPHDGNGHGTHCTGTICGTTNGIGVAPGAQWIACRGLDDEGSGDEKTLLSCGQFMACPSGNATGNCTGFPDVVSNSWGGLVGGQDFYNAVINVWRSLNIIPVFALGNSGPLCMTSGSPGDQDNLISVGATDNLDKMARFSSRGPALLTGKTKPEVSAPGNKITSATHDSNTGYRVLSGTSMACPHVAGAVALILSANPKAKTDFKLVLDTLEKTAYKPTLFWTDSPMVCSFPARYPNNSYGYGRVNVTSATEAIANARR